MNNMKCSLCPNGCKINKDSNVGLCGTDNSIRIAKYYLHPYEEPPISGKRGSGTVFFCGCSLKCVFCQNYELSRNLRGKVISTNELADIFKQLEENGAHNINLVNPTHYSNKIIDAFKIYRPSIPVVYNTHGYENKDILEKMNEYVDVYLPDIKFFSPTLSKRYTGKENYFEIASSAIEFMIKSKPTVFDQNGLMKQGVIVRHLVLPQGVSDSKKILDWYQGVKGSSYINVMSQYTPFGEIDAFPELKRKITAREYDSVIDYAMSLGIDNMFYQAQDSASEEYIPKWDY
ncbi:MAG: radical SAM protein [Clostridiales bacterium]|nr:radical SAM protein [Clostridiales bacterium]